MRWIRIDKNAAPRPGAGGYKAWKAQLAQEAEHRCVYCAIHEAAFGGIRNFHIDHFRPRSLFPDLTDSYQNVFFACAICNVFKGSAWPADPDPNAVSFLDPSRTDYNEVLVPEENYIVIGACIAGTYMVERLHLNRPQLIQERRMYRQLVRLRGLAMAAQELMTRSKLSSERIRELAAVSLRINDLMAQAGSIAPYRMDETRNVNEN